MKNSLITPLTLFRRVLNGHGQRTAVEDGNGNRMTYSQLDKKSSLLARHLLHIGAVPGQPIPILTSSCIDMVVGVLGILKTGATYVPIDREQWPQERISYVLSRCNAGIVVYTGGEIAVDNCKTVHLPLPGGVGKGSHVNDEEPGADVMCIIFTSGTTSKPKGVAIRSSAVATFVSSPGFNYDVCAGDRVLLILSVAFDACMGTMFTTICNGGTVVLANSLNFQWIGRTCNILVLTPSILETFSPPESPTDYKKVKKIVLGGETPPRTLLEAWSIIDIPIWLAYGPTEATCAVLTECLTRVQDTREYHPNRFSQFVPGANIQLLDGNMEPVEELGREEEICISGKCLAVGYWLDEKLTQERFVLHRGNRIYRTGDLGKWVITEQGKRAIEFCGRRDRVTKIRGFLVNLDLDVDAALLHLNDNIRSAFSLVIDGKLCTAFVSAVPVDEKMLLAKWRVTVAPYMVPDHIFALDQQLPLTPSGKIDPKGVAALLQTKFTTIVTTKESYSVIDEVILDGVSSVLNVPPSEIALTESLVSQGMHSLGAAKVASFCRRHGFDVSVQDIMIQPSVQLLISACRDKKSVSSNTGYELQPVSSNPNDVIVFQKKMILASMQDTRLYRVKHISHYRTQQIPKLMKAWESVVSTEPSFRIEFKTEGADLTHSVAYCRDIHWNEATVYCDDDIYSELSRLDLETGLRSIFKVLNFDGPNLPKDESMVIWSTHHALIDGFSASLVFDKVDAALKGQTLDPSPPYSLVVQDLSRWQASVARQAETFWTEQETLYPAAAGDLLIPENTDQSHGCYKTYTTAEKLNLNDIGRAARRANVTRAVIFYAAWALVLGTYSNSDKVVFGAVLSGRNLPFTWAETFIGAMINTLPLRIHFKRQDNPTQLLQTMHNILQSLSVICAANPPRNGPRFQTVLVVQEPGLKPGPTEISPLQDPYIQEYTDLRLSAIVEPDGRLKFLYNDAEISTSQVHDMASVFTNTINALTDEKLIRVSEIFDQQLSQSVIRRLLKMGNADSEVTRMDAAEDTIVSRFYATAASVPDYIAVEKAGRRLSYTALARAVNMVSRVVQALVPGGETVAVLADRSINWIVAVFGALAANTIYCPLDSTYSKEYQAELLRRSKTKLLLVPTMDDWRGLFDKNIVVLGVDQILDINISPTLCSRRLPSPSDKAYLCFTSGSTGKPKGVLCEHRGVVSFHSSPETALHSAPGTRIAQFLSPGFDCSIHEILSTICFGGTLVLRKDDNDPFSHLQDVDVAVINPSVAAHLSPSDHGNLKYLYLVGEAVPQTTVDRWAPGRHLYNGYGPTETTIVVCQQRLLAGVPVNIGPPAQSVRAYILNEHLELQPPGTMGSIYVAGVQVGPGYLDMPEVTKKEFIRDPFVVGSLDERMYCTGDVGFWDESGNIHCCGRRDRQIKLNGYRINLDSISKAAYQCMPEISACAATIEKKFVVLWVEPVDVCVPQLERQLRAHLPPHAVPKRIRVIDKIPLSKNGKLDVKSLASRHPDQERVEVKVATTGRGLRQILADEWRLLLGLSPSVELDGSDEFTQRGGDSILQLSLAARMKKIFGIAITPKDIIEAISLDDMVDLVERLGQNGVSNGTKDFEPTTLPLGLKALSSTEAWWFHRYSTSQCQSGFNVPYVAKLSSIVNVKRLAWALETVLNRHRILRSLFVVAKGAPERLILDKYIPVSSEISVDIDSFINRPFDLAKEQPVRAAITPLHVVLSMSHIVCDLTSQNAILGQTAALYAGQALPPVSREYFDMTTWSQPIDPEKGQFWTKTLEGLDFSQLNKGDKNLRSYRGTSMVTPIPTDLYGQLVLATGKSGVTLHQIGLTVTGLVLHVLCQRDDVVLGAPFINRFSTEDQDVVGLFLEPLPVRVRIADENCDYVRDLIHDVRQSSQAALANAMPWSILAEHLGLSARPELNQIFDCVVTFHDDRAFTESLSIDGVSSQHVWTQGSKFAMLFEWHAFADRLSLRLEYDTDRFSESFAKLLRDMLLEALQLVLCADNTHSYVKKHLLTLLNNQCLSLGMDIKAVHDLATAFLMGP